MIEIACQCKGSWKNTVKLFFLHQRSREVVLGNTLSMMASVLALLNRRIYASKLDQCWAKPLVDTATDVLAHHDPLGLLDMGCPDDEYEPEALYLVRVLLGFQDEEALWASAPRPLPDTTCAEVQAACAEAFAELFGEQHRSAITELIAAHLWQAIYGAEVA
jgi:hypothetical protein